MSTLSVLPAITRLPARTHFCEVTSREGRVGICELAAVVSLDGQKLCKQHAVDKLNAAHQAAVEEVNSLTRTP